MASTNGELQTLLSQHAAPPTKPFHPAWIVLFGIVGALILLALDASPWWLIVPAVFIFLGSSSRARRMHETELEQYAKALRAYPHKRMCLRCGTFFFDGEAPKEGGSAELPARVSHASSSAAGTCPSASSRPLPIGADGPSDASASADTSSSPTDPVSSTPEALPPAIGHSSSLACRGDALVRRAREMQRYVALGLLVAWGGPLVLSLLRGGSVLSYIQNGRIWLLFLGIGVPLMWAMSRLVEYNARRASAALIFYSDVLHVCYTACQPPLDLEIPRTAVDRVDIEASNIEGDHDRVVIRFQTPTVAETVQAKVRTRFGLAMLFGSPWSDGLWINSGTPDAKTIKGRIVAWLDTHPKSA